MYKRQALFGEKQIGVNVQEVSFYMAWIGILRVSFQSVLINPLLKKFNEDTILKIGIFALIFTMTFLIFSNNIWIVYIPVSFLAFGTGVVRPILSSKLTKAVKKEETGSLLGVNNSLMSVGQILTPIIGGLILQLLPTQTLPTISALIFIVIFISWRWTISVKDEKKKIIESKVNVINS